MKSGYFIKNGIKNGTYNSLVMEYLDIRKVEL